MKWYLGGRTKNIPEFMEITKFLESRGEIVNSDWIYEGNLRPFEENFEKVQSLAERCVKQILDTDIFVAFNEQNIKDLFVEIGVALAHNEMNSEKKIKIYIIDCAGKNTVLQNHPSIIHVKDLKEVFEKEGVDYTGFEIPVLV